MNPTRGRHTGDLELYPGIYFDGEGGAGGGAGEAGAGAGGEGGSGEGGEAGGAAGAGAGEGGTGGEGGAGGETVTMTKAEVEALQQAAATANRAARAAEKKLEKEATAGKEKAGEHEELYNNAKAELERVKGVVGTNAVKTEVTAIAQRLGFRNPALAINNISVDGVEPNVDLTGDSPTVDIEPGAKTILEGRLKALLEAEPYLKGEPPQRQLPGAGSEGGGNGGGANAEMNAQIRRAAGRTA